MDSIQYTTDELLRQQTTTSLESAMQTKLLELVEKKSREVQLLDENANLTAEIESLWGSLNNLKDDVRKLAPLLYKVTVNADSAMHAGDLFQGVGTDNFIDKCKTFLLAIDELIAFEVIHQ